MSKNNDSVNTTAVAEPITNANTPTIVYATEAPGPTVVQATYVTPQSTENSQIGICRRCRREFVRNPSVNDGQAQYYRCQQCEGFRLQDLIEGSCLVC